VGKKKLVSLFLIATLASAPCFFGVKVIEYKQKSTTISFPGWVDMRYRSEHPTATDDPKEIAIEKEEVEKTFAVDPDTNAHGSYISRCISP